MRLHRRTFVLIAAAFLAACQPAADKQGKGDQAAAAADPAEVIRPLYTRYTTDPAATTFPSLEEQAPWSASMRQALVDMMAQSRAINEPILDFDPFANAQDWQISNVNVVNEAVSEGSHAVVRASFTNAGFNNEVVYDLIWEDGGWRVDNMRSDSAGVSWDLRAIVTQVPSTTTAD